MNIVKQNPRVAHVRVINSELYRSNVKSVTNIAFLFLKSDNTKIALSDNLNHRLVSIP
ncbi:hypothetical protein GCM10011412_26170 [Maribacter cobaltidurans]|nr:hypothetical protein GCM10011412_26170 [Maribacter cobaltidurans]